MNPVRVLIADSNPLVRGAIRYVLERGGDVDVLEEVTDAKALAEAAGRRQPDVALIQRELPGLDGTPATEVVRSMSPGTKVILLLPHADGADPEPHANGQMLEPAADELVEAVRAVAGGALYVSPRAVSARESRSGMSPEIRARLKRLTPRQREVLRYIADGYSTREIAERLGRAVKTIETHRAHLMDRVGAGSVADLVKFAIRAGLTDVE